MMLRTSPCKDCQNRHLNCHSECDTYLAFAGAKRQQGEKRLADARMDDIIADTQKRLKRRYT